MWTEWDDWDEARTAEKKGKGEQQRSGARHCAFLGIDNNEDLGGVELAL